MVEHDGYLFFVTINRTRAIAYSAFVNFDLVIVTNLVLFNFLIRFFNVSHVNCCCEWFDIYINSLLVSCGLKVTLLGLILSSSVISSGLSIFQLVWSLTAWISKGKNNQFCIYVPHEFNPTLVTLFFFCTYTHHTCISIKNIKKYNLFGKCVNNSNNLL